MVSLWGFFFFLVLLYFAWKNSLFTIPRVTGFLQEPLQPPLTNASHHLWTCVLPWELLLEAPGASSMNHICQQDTPWLRSLQRPPLPTWPHPNFAQQPRPFRDGLAATCLSEPFSPPRSEPVLPKLCMRMTRRYGSCEMQVLVELIWGRAETPPLRRAPR